MHCILFRGDPDVWELRRSVEVLAYHRERQEVSILAVASVQKLKAGPKHLYMLHRGNVECSKVKSGRAARHPDEVNREGDTIWWSVYKKEFEVSAASIVESGGILTRTKERTCLDSFVPAADEIIKSTTRLWPAEVSGNPVIAPCPRGDGPDVPFTEWPLGPFDPTGEILITVGLTFSGATYRRLLGDDESFTIDGPQRVLDAIESIDLINLPPQSRSSWEKLLQPYKTFLPAKYGYDVILLSHPCKADNIEIKGLSRIIIAPYQPEPRGAGLRFVSGSANFQLVLGYSDVNEERRNARFAQRFVE